MALANSRDLKTVTGDGSASPRKASNTIDVTKSQSPSSPSASKMWHVDLNLRESDRSLVRSGLLNDRVIDATSTLTEPINRHVAGLDRFRRSVDGHSQDIARCRAGKLTMAILPSAPQTNTIDCGVYASCRVRNGACLWQRSYGVAVSLIPRLHDEASSSSARRALDERSSSQLVEPASSCKRGIRRVGNARPFGALSA